MAKKPDKATTAALKIGRQQAERALSLRAKARARRAKALQAHTRSLTAHAVAAGLPKPVGIAENAGVLVAEGDSWFDYPLHDILKMLEDDYGYDIESVAHKGDRIEEMAYGANQRDDLIRKLEKL